MDPTLIPLFDSAGIARSRAYAPYSNHPVGAAILGANGQIYSGANVENSAYPTGTCAEAGAIAAMIVAGETKIAHIAIAGPGTHLCAPCGNCRQRVREFSDAATLIHVLDISGALMRSYTIEQLLPDSFGPENVAEVNPNLKL